MRMRRKFSEIQKVHFIGVGGIGISGLARLCLHEGKEVSGSDLSVTTNSKKLEAEGVQVRYEQDGDLSAYGDLDLVVYSDGVTEETKGWAELTAARESGVETVTYFEAVAAIANEYYLIAVAGTHGKTTTTAMLVDILEEAGFDPTAIVGSLRTKTGSNFRAGKSKYFVVEADEYREHFLYFDPDVLIITNIDHDHVDYYHTLADVQAVFTKLVAKVPQDGAIVANVADPHVAPVLTGAAADVIDYREHLDLSFPLKQPGLHNRMNAAAATTAVAFLGVDAQVTNKALSNFAGTARRFEYKGTCNGALVYDEYAHNPQKVAAAIAGAKEMYGDKKLIVLFEPHTYTRTKALFTEFVSSLLKADHVMLLPIYAAREEDVYGVSHVGLAEALQKAGTDAVAFDSYDMAVDAVLRIADENSIVLVMGAGTVTQVADMLTKSVKG